jgi:XTP/dITP diphosphohydrolase
VRLLLATTNTHKAKEIKSILSDRTDLEIIMFKEIRNLTPIVEDGMTFKDNAVKKAVSCARQSGLLTVADDSGLCVDALSGAPGVMSARFAGEERNDLANCQKLLALLSDLPPAKRTARFECHIAFADSQGLVSAVSGSVKGLIAEGLRGKNGFGYDPLFLYPALNKTFAEITPDLKNRISHRAQALASFKQVLFEYLERQKKTLDN